MRLLRPDHRRRRPDGPDGRALRRPRGARRAGDRAERPGRPGRRHRAARQLPRLPRGHRRRRVRRPAGAAGRRFGVEMLQAQEVTGLRAEAEYALRHDRRRRRVRRAARCWSRPARPTAGSACPARTSLIGAGIHFCATCDGPFYRGQQVAVIGGGNSAGEESLFLARFASQVTHPGARRGADRQQDRAGEGRREPEDRRALQHRGRGVRRATASCSGVAIRDRATGATEEIASGRRLRLHRPLAEQRLAARRRSRATSHGFIVTDADAGDQPARRLRGRRCRAGQHQAGRQRRRRGRDRRAGDPRVSQGGVGRGGRGAGESTPACKRCSLAWPLAFAFGGAGAWPPRTWWGRAVRGAVTREPPVRRRAPPGQAAADGGPLPRHHQQRPGAAAPGASPLPAARSSA